MSECISQYWVPIVITDLIIGIIPAVIASNKGKKFYTWYIYGVLLFFFAMIHAIVIPEKDSLVEVKPEVVTKLKEVGFVNIDCPIDIIGYEISTYNDDKTYCNINFINLSNKKVLSVKMDVMCYDSFGEVVGKNNIKETVVQDICANYKENFNSKILLLEHLSTRKVDIVIKKILFEDNTSWINEGTMLLKNELNKPKDDMELLNLLKIVGKDAICYPKKDEKTWMCVCGCTNYSDIHNCRRCDRDKDVIFSKYINQKSIEQEIEILTKNELENKKLRKVQNKKAVKEVSIGIGILLVVWISCHLFKMYSYRLRGDEVTQYTNFITQYNEKKSEIYNDSYKAFEAFQVNDEEKVKQYYTYIMDNVQNINDLNPPQKYEKIFERLKNELYKEWLNKKIWNQYYFDSEYIHEETKRKEMDEFKNNYDQAQKEIKGLENKINNKYYIPD